MRSKDGLIEMARNLRIQCVVVSFLLAAAGSSAQQPTNPAQAPQAAPAVSMLEYDVVSVKEFKASGNDLGSSWGWDPGGLTAMNLSLRSLICLAWGINSYQLSGGPGWLDTALFQIQAKTDEATAEKLKQLTPDQGRAMQKRMLQAILTDRFKLTLRHETRPLPGYALVVAKGGSRLHEVAATDDDSNAVKGRDGTPLSRGSWTMNSENGSVVHTGHAVAIEMLITQLAATVNRKVNDETGLKGVYDFKLRFAQDRGLSADPGFSGNASGPDAVPTLFDALQEQLGLKLEPRKVADDALIVEHVEMPTEN